MRNAILGNNLKLNLYLSILSYPKREILICLSLINRTARFRFVDMFLVWVYDQSLMWYPMQKELIKHEIPLVTKQLSQSYNLLNVSEKFFVSSYLRILKSVRDNTPFQKSFERIIGLFVTITTINIHEKIGTRKKSPHNRIVRIIEVQIIKVWLYSNYFWQVFDV